MQTFYRTTPQVDTIEYRKPSAASAALTASHDAAWDRYLTAEQALRHDHSPAAQREYNEAAKQLQYVRNLFFVASLGKQS